MSRCTRGSSGWKASENFQTFGDGSPKSGMPP
eukprot:CAMPEP_0183592632 /NCGR_PEP_ID=MMETSP0371-20130417/168317_1 /TAXON_ID=268820 /ORGANISM="Peridinium aciculiferum, Strain PAER-2" /LENGTH=31 /DNA_ID= /DNA_START= /DNA_END= /DNA_ORIENTATION=